MWETWVQSLDWENPLEEGKVTYSSILSGESHGLRSLAGDSPYGCKESERTEAAERACKYTNTIDSRDITLPTKVHLVKAMIFPVVMDGCESWTINKAERGGIHALQLWCWRRFLRVSWTAKRSVSQS